MSDTRARQARKDIIDDLTLRLEEHRAFWDLLGSIAALCANADSDDREAVGGLWMDWEALSKRLGDECGEMRHQVGKAYVLAERAAQQAAPKR
jgi:hypothetical protein